MPEPATRDWRPVYSERFLTRAIQRPERPQPYVRPTDEQIDALPTQFRALALLARSMNDTFAAAAAQVAQTLRPAP